jgi:hypothetical protein
LREWALTAARFGAGKGRVHRLRPPPGGPMSTSAPLCELCRTARSSMGAVYSKPLTTEPAAAQRRSFSAASAIGPPVGVCPLVQSLLTARANDPAAGHCPTGATRPWCRAADGSDPPMPLCRDGVIAVARVGPHGAQSSELGCWALGCSISGSVRLIVVEIKAAQVEQGAPLAFDVGLLILVGGPSGGKHPLGG